MLTRSNAASNGAAASAPSAASTRNSGDAAAAVSQQPSRAAMTNDDPADNATSIASEAAATSLASPAAASSLSGHKRAAEARHSAFPAPSSASAAAAPSLSSDSKQPVEVSNEHQSKKQRGGSSSQGSSVAAAASSVGFESVAAPSTEAAASSAGVSGSLSYRIRGATQPSVADDEEKEPQHAASSSSAAAADAPLQADSRDDEAQRIFVAAQRLIRGALTFTESVVHRLNPPSAAEVKGRMAQLADAEAELRSIPAEPTEEQSNQRAAKQAQIEELAEWLQLKGGFAHYALGVIRNARAATQQPAALTAISQLGDLCFLLSDISALSPSERTVLGSWLLQANDLFTRLCNVLPLVALTAHQSRRLLHAAADSGALQLIPVLMRGKTECEFSVRTIADDPHLTFYCLHPREHCVCLEPYLRLFEFGLDPTLIEVGGNLLSALQLARNFMRNSLVPAVAAAVVTGGPIAEMQAVVSRDSDSQPAWSVLAAHATVHPESWPDETPRREALHARFMHALISAWHSHSDKVYALLLEAAPTRLIPPLVDVVARYLDLEGTPPERAAPVEEAAEMTD